MIAARRSRRGTAVTLFLLTLPPVALSACTSDGVSQPVHAGGCDSRFQVVNRSSGVVERLYFSSSNNNEWGADQLGQNVLGRGRMATYRASYAGNYDFKVVWSNGESAELRQVNVCRASRITVTNNGLSAS